MSGKKQFGWSTYLSGSGEVDVEIPRRSGSYTFDVEDEPGIPGASNSSDPSVVTLAVIKTRFWRPNIVRLAWNVAGVKLVTFVAE